MHFYSIWKSTGGSFFLFFPFSRSVYTILLSALASICLWKFLNNSLEHSRAHTHTHAHTHLVTSSLKIYTFLSDSNLMSVYWFQVQFRMFIEKKLKSWQIPTLTKRALLSIFTSLIIDHNSCFFHDYSRTGLYDHGYNELTVITNNIKLLVWFSIIYQWNFKVIPYKNNPNHSYNEQKIWDSNNFFRI